MPHRNQTWLPGPNKTHYSVRSLDGRINAVTWVGINDLLRFYDTNQQLTKLFELQDLLYQTGARNFLFFNIPPYNRAPIGSPPDVSR